MNNQQEFKNIIDQHLLKMIDIINSVAVPMEGSLFFDDQVVNININQIQNHHYEKMFNLANFAIGKSNLLEVGFNSGFSALVFLSANPNVNVTSVDLCGYEYTKPCYEYLKSQFGDRINLLKGSSTEVLPELLPNTHDYDAYFIDGGHSEDVTGSDFKYIIQYALDGTEIYADDYNFPLIRNIVQKHIANNELTMLNDFDNTALLRVVK